MEIDIQLLTRFERELIPHDLSRSSVPAEIIGFGEISAIFQIGEDPDIIYKRLPLFQIFKPPKPTNICILNIVHC